HTSVNERHSLHCYVDFSEMCEAVCLRPYADLARIDERLVTHLDEVRAVEPHLELFTVTFQTKRMPDVFQDRQILPGHLPADTADHLVKPDVVLKCISACDVIVIGVLQSNDNPGSLVYVTIDCLEAYGDKHVLRTETIPNA